MPQGLPQPCSRLENSRLPNAAIKARPAVERGRVVPERLELGTNKEEFIKGARTMLA